MDGFRLTAKQVVALRTLHRSFRDKRLAYRVNAIILLGSGWSVAEVAQALLVDETTLYLWLEKYQHGGKDELLALHYQGKACSLTEQQQTAVVKHVDKQIFRHLPRACWY